jgi:hypothetical protein
MLNKKLSLLEEVLGRGEPYAAKEPMAIENIIY